MDVGIAVNVAALSISLVALGISTRLAIQQLRTAQTNNRTVVQQELLFRECRSNEFLESEDFVLNRLATEFAADRGITELPYDARKHILRIGLYFAGLGALSACQAVSDDVILGAVHWRVSKAWAVLKPYIVSERLIQRNDYLSYFEHLACVAASIDKKEILDRQGVRRFDHGAPG